MFREADSNFTQADWAREQQQEYECSAAMRFILLGRPAELPADFFGRVPKHRRTPLSGITELADLTRLIHDDGRCLLARNPTSGQPGGRAARLSN